MTDVLKDEGDFWQLDFRAQKVIMIVPELSICEVIPSMTVSLYCQVWWKANGYIRASISIQ
jgi:hypothetical protein